MSVIRVKHQQNYVVLLKEILEDNEISLKAKGLWAFCMAKPDDWEFHVDQLEKTLKEGKSALYSTLDELTQFGYVKKIQGKGPTGQFQAVDYEIFETSILKKSLPLTDFPHADLPHADNQQLLSNNPTKTEAKASSTTTIKRDVCSGKEKFEERYIPDAEEGSHLEYTKPDATKKKISISDIYRILMPLNYATSEIVEAIKVARTTQYIGDPIRFLQGTIEKRREKRTHIAHAKPARNIPGNDNEYTYKGKSICKIYAPQKITKPMV